MVSQGLASVQTRDFALAMIKKMLRYRSKYDAMIGTDACGCDLSVRTATCQPNLGVPPFPLLVRMDALMSRLNCPYAVSKGPRCGAPQVTSGANQLCLALRDCARQTTRRAQCEKEWNKKGYQGRRTLRPNTGLSVRFSATLLQSAGLTQLDVQWQCPRASGNAPKSSHLH